MNFKALLGQTFTETELYELLLFEIEENFEQYFSKFMHLYFDRSENKKIKITEVHYFKDDSEMDKKARSMIEKKEWFQLYETHKRLDLLLVRFDRTGTHSSVKKNKTRTEDWRAGWADERPRKPMTREEIQEAFCELAGVFQNAQELQKSKYKKAV